MSIHLVRFLLLVIGCSYHVSVFGQTGESKVFMGPELDYSKRSTLKGIVGYDNSGFYTLRANLLSAKLNIVRYSNELKEEKAVNHSLRINDVNRSFERVIQIGEKLYLLTSFSDKKSKRNRLYSQEIDKKSLVLGRKQTVLAEIDFTNERKGNSGSFRMAISRDSSKLLVYYNLPWNKGESEKFGFNVYDQNLILLWEKEVTLPHLEELFEVMDYEVSNSGKVFMLGRVFDEKKRYERRGKPNYTYHVLSYDSQDDVTEYPIANNEKYFVDMAIAVGDDENIICSGFYSENGTYSINGSYFFKMSSASKGILVESFKEFDLDFITQNMNDRSKKKVEKKSEKGKDAELFHIDLDGIILRDDGGAVLIGEQFFIETYTTVSSSGARSTTYIYRYNDIIIVNIDPLGQIEWNQKIAKKQVSRNDGGFFSSYATAVVGSKIHFVFNDNAKNLTLREGDKINSSTNNKETIITMVTVNGDGRQSRKALFATRDSEILARPKVGRQISDKELIIYGQRGKAHRFAKVVFD